jgi:ribosomal protein L29
MVQVQARQLPEQVQLRVLAQQELASSLVERLREQLNLRIF